MLNFREHRQQMILSWARSHLVCVISRCCGTTALPSALYKILEVHSSEKSLVVKRRTSTVSLLRFLGSTMLNDDSPEFRKCSDCNYKLHDLNVHRHQSGLHVPPSRGGNNHYPISWHAN